MISTKSRIAFGTFPDWDVRALPGSWDSGGLCATTPWKGSSLILFRCTNTSMPMPIRSTGVIRVDTSRHQECSVVQLSWQGLE